MDAANLIRQFKRVVGTIVITASTATASPPAILAKPTVTANDSSKQLPAVPNVTGWLGAAGDYLTNDRGSGAGGVAEAGIALPFALDIAAQLHAIYGAAGGAHLSSTDALLFWRDPAKGLIGVHTMYTVSGHYYNYLYGLHGDAYFNGWTLTGEGGGVDTRRNNTYYLEALLSGYPRPNWRVYAGAIELNGDGGAQFGSEYLLGFKKLPGLSLFFDFEAGAHHLRYGMLGLRYYFGDRCNPDKTLIQRHRQDMVPATLNLLTMHKRIPPRFAEI